MNVALQFHRVVDDGCCALSVLLSKQSNLLSGGNSEGRALSRHR
jgi:hypothetical protein